MRLPEIPTTDSDPSGLFGAIGGFAGAVAALLVVTGVLDGETADAIVAVVLAGLPILTALGIRRHAYAPRTVRVAENLASFHRDPSSFHDYRNPDHDPEEA